MTIAEATLDAGQTNLADRIELRRFVGRELLLWLWMESELFDATLSTPEHGSFGLWMGGQLVLNEGREATVIRGSLPGAHREAKEALLRGKTPDRAGLQLSFGGRQCALILRGDTLAFAGLVPPKKEKEAETAVALAPPPRPRKGKSKGKGKEPEAQFDEAYEVFYERMYFARDVEALITALYRVFLTLRLSRTWGDCIVPTMHAWVAGETIDAERYQRKRDKAFPPARTSRN